MNVKDVCFHMPETVSRIDSVEEAARLAATDEIGRIIRKQVYA